MCRGCRIKRNGECSCEEYLDWLDDYINAIASMKSAEKKMLSYIEGIDDLVYKKLIDDHRRNLIRIRRSYGKEDGILSSKEENPFSRLFDRDNTN